MKRPHPDASRAQRTGPNRRQVGAASLALLAATPVIGADLPRGGDDVEFGPGEHLIEGNRTIVGTVTVRPGARLRLGVAATLTLRGDLVAPADLLFVGDGRVDLTGSRVIAARPEWWGAVPDDARVDCEPAITACLGAHPFVQLGLGDYHLRATLVINQPNRRLWGVGRTNAARGTRLLIAGGEAPVLRVGTEQPPAAINNYLRGIDVRWIELGRTHAPVPDGEGGSRAGGLVVRHVLDAVFEGLRANEHAIGFSFRGAVKTLVTDCAAFRSVFADPARDLFVGFDLDGTDSPIATGGNASLYLTDCNARTGNRPAIPISVGCRITGAFSDTFLTRFETTELAHGILVDGLAGSPAAPRSAAANLDLHLDTPVLDQCTRAAIVLRRLPATAMVDIASCWLSVAAGADAALLITDAGGATSVVAGQMVGPGEGSTVGVRIDRASGVALAGTKVWRFARPVAATSASALDLVLAVIGAPPANAPAITLATSRGTYVRARLVGGGFAAGVALDRCSAVTVDMAGIADAREPVVVDGRPAGATGAQLWAPASPG